MRRSRRPGRIHGLTVDLTSFTGPRIASGTVDVSTVSSGLNGGLSFDFDDDVPQFAGAGRLLLGRRTAGCSTPTRSIRLTFAQGGDLLLGGDYLSDVNTDRSDLEVDGVPAYAAATAEDVVAGAQDFTGLPTLTFSSSQDPTTGDVVVHESELLVSCEPSPATYPASTTSCTSFQSTGVRFDRTIVQRPEPAVRSISPTPTRASTASLTRSTSATDRTSTTPMRASTSRGSTARMYETHTTGDTIAPPPSSPATVFLKFDNDIPDGDETSAQGAITFAQAPSGFDFLADGL